MHIFYFSNKLLPIFAAVALVRWSLGRALGQEYNPIPVQNPLNDGSAVSSNPVPIESQRRSEDVDRDWNEFDNCKISDEDARGFPWLAIMRISENESEESEKDKYWPAVIISRYTLLTGGRAFRSPHSDGKFMLEPTKNYHIRLKDQVQRRISHVRLHPNSSMRTKHWMSADDDFALIHLEEPITFTRQIRPLCLPDWSESWYNQTAHDKRSIIEPGDVNLISGWKCYYHFALVQADTAFKLLVEPWDYCISVWTRQAEYSPIEGTVYKNRICGTPTTKETRNGTGTLDTEDHGLCVEKFYFNIQTTHAHDENTHARKRKHRQDEEPPTPPRRTVVGIFNGIAHEVFAGPTAYVLTFTPDTLRWINEGVNCGPNQYACDNGQCIGLQLVCDQNEQCSDGSDENPIYCRAKNFCKSNEFECGVYGDCVPAVNSETGKMAMNCDGVRDCALGEDETEAVCGTKDKVNSMTLYLASTIVAGIIVLFGIGAFVTYKRSQRRRSLFLTDEEVSEFRQGVQDANSDDIFGWEFSYGMNGAEDPDDVQLNSMQMPYIYDLDKSKIQFREEIGGGAFGVVYKGFVDGKIAAIKVLKRDIVNKEMFKTFLVELKIMAYVNFIKGGHENVIRLVGAYTEEIRNFELYIAVEFCGFGSITDYLRENKHKFRAKELEEAQVNDRIQEFPQILVYTPELPSESYVTASSLEQQFDATTLLKWSQQIVNGMDFLSRHKIVHGDLAVRNILLDYNLTAKISDFGLSRQMYYYNSASAKIQKDAQLPWRWMAPEVLANMSISSKSDVWSFGVTTWELFTLGAIPYGGLEWSPSFIDQLKCGLRLTRPQYANDELFNLIQECWTYSVDARPDFGSIKKILLTADFT